MGDLFRDKVMYILDKLFRELKSEYGIEVEITSRIAWFDDWCVGIKVYPEMHAHELEDMMDLIEIGGEPGVKFSVSGGCDYTDTGEILTGEHTLVLWK